MVGRPLCLYYGALRSGGGYYLYVSFGKSTQSQSGVVGYSEVPSEREDLGGCLSGGACVKTARSMLNKGKGKRRPRNTRGTVAAKIAQRMSHLQKEPTIPLIELGRSAVTKRARVGRSPPQRLTPATGLVSPWRAACLQTADSDLAIGAVG